MNYLMYRDWSGFELFFIEILKCTSIPPCCRSAPLRDLPGDALPRGAEALGAAAGPVERARRTPYPGVERLKAPVRFW
jgi:hypothetical protein